MAKPPRTWPNRQIITAARFRANAAVIGGQQFVASGFARTSSAPVQFGHQDDPELADADRMLVVRALTQLLQTLDEQVVVLRPTDPATPDLYLERGQDEQGPFVILSVK